MRISSQQKVKYCRLCVCSVHIYPLFSAGFIPMFLVVYFLFNVIALAFTGQMLDTELFLLVPTYSL